MKKKAFTLLEMLIVIVILWIFSGVLFRTYNIISDISFRIEQQRKINEELLFLSEILQNFANRNSIDFDAYEYNWVNQLKYSKWFTWVLYLSWDDWKFHIFSSWECVDFSQVPDTSQLWSGCALYLQYDNDPTNPVKLTESSVYFTRAKFKIIPYSDKYFTDSLDTCDTNYFACVNDDWFWLFVDVYPKLYKGDNWANNVHLLVQQFFNI